MIYPFIAVQGNAGKTFSALKHYLEMAQNLGKKRANRGRDHPAPEE